MPCSCASGFHLLRWPRRSAPPRCARCSCARGAQEGAGRGSRGACRPRSLSTAASRAASPAAAARPNRRRAPPPPPAHRLQQRGVLLPQLSELPLQLMHARHHGAAWCSGSSSSKFWGLVGSGRRALPCVASVCDAQSRERRASCAVCQRSRAGDCRRCRVLLLKRAQLSNVRAVSAAVRVQIGDQESLLTGCVVPDCSRDDLHPPLRASSLKGVIGAPAELHAAAAGRASLSQVAASSHARQAVLQREARWRQS